MWLGMWKAWGKSLLYLSEHNLPAPSSTPWSLVPAATSSANLIRVKKQFNPRWAQSLHGKNWNLSHCCLSSLSAFVACKNVLLKWPCVRSSLLGMDPTRSLFLCFPGASMGLFPLTEPVPRSHLNVTWADCGWITCSYTFEASTRSLHPRPTACGTSTTCKELAACQASEREPGLGRRVRDAADGCAFVSDMWRLADLILLLCHSLAVLCCISISTFQKQTKMQSREAFFKTPRGGRGGAFV